ncbi:hypothetical protein A0H81_02957 [Grifola frondosa]|uniref:Uncharacterized protein n=1 Tax=Grifola frondosa TaxID=5627 RepID=A0A1C7MHE1_GRIFR|nr:hypothetical protein A0H81_02957 [Grifola frondosa]
MSSQLETGMNNMATRYFKASSLSPINLSKVVDISPWNTRITAVWCHSLILVLTVAMEISEQVTKILEHLERSATLQSVRFTHHYK